MQAQQAQAILQGGVDAVNWLLSLPGTPAGPAITFGGGTALGTSVFAMGPVYTYQYQPTVGDYIGAAAAIVPAVDVEAITVTATRTVTNAVREFSWDFLGDEVGSIGERGVNWRSRPQFGHTFSRHGAGASNTANLAGRAAGTGTPQGQWLDNSAAADFLSSLGLDGPVSVQIPDGLGQLVMPDGSTSPANWATVVPSNTGLRTAYPIPGGN